MKIKLQAYTNTFMHDDLSSIEELFLLYYRHDYNCQPFTSHSLLEDLGLSEQYVRKINRSLISKGYMNKTQRALDLVVPKLSSQLIPTEFLFSEDLTTTEKKAVISIYKQCARLGVIDTSLLDLDITLDDTYELFEKLADIGIFSTEPFDFTNFFKNISVYDI